MTDSGEFIDEAGGDVAEAGGLVAPPEGEAAPAPGPVLNSAQRGHLRFVSTRESTNEMSQIG